jgi:hypothetical protein
VSIVASFLVPPPVIATTRGGDGAWSGLSQFVVAITVGLLFVPMRLWKTRRFLWAWWGIALASFALSITSFLLYNHWIGCWLASYDGELVVIGSTLTDHARIRQAELRLTTAEDLLMAYAGRSEEIWTRGSIEVRRQTLAIGYILSLPLFTASILSMLQALACVKASNATRTRPHVVQKLDRAR